MLRLLVAVVPAHPVVHHLGAGMLQLLVADCAVSIGLGSGTASRIVPVLASVGFLVIQPSTILGSVPS